MSRNLLSLMEEEALEAVRAKTVGVVGLSISGGGGGGSRSRKPWEEDYILKRQFSALIPAFDPRPGRTNLHQTTGT